MSLNDQLDSLTAKLRAMVPAERLAVVDLRSEELSHSGLAERALKAGDHAPSFRTPRRRRHALALGRSAPQRAACDRLLSRTLVRLLQCAARSIAGNSSADCRSRCVAGRHLTADAKALLHDARHAQAALPCPERRREIRLPANLGWSIGSRRKCRRCMRAS